MAERIASDIIRTDWEYAAAEGTPSSALSDATPRLSVEGFEGPLDFLLEMARRHRIDLGRLAILPLIDQFVAAFEAARERVPFERRGDWLVMASTLLLLKAQLLWPATPETAAAAEAEATRRRPLSTSWPGCAPRRPGSRSGRNAGSTCSRADAARRRRRREPSSPSPSSN